MKRNFWFVAMILSLLAMVGCREGGKTNGTPTPYQKVENPTAAEDLWYIVEDGEVKIAGLVNMDITELRIPNGVTEISSGLFDGCTNLTSVVFLQKQR